MPQQPRFTLRRPRLRASVLLLAALAAMLTSPVSLCAADVSEQELKAAVLFRAAKFIEWPTSAFSTSDSAFVMCLVGDAADVSAFDSIRNKQISTHPINVRQVTGDMLDLRQCHIAYFPSMSDADVDYAVGKFRGMPVLTVGESSGFAQRGGMFALITRNQRVQFAVNLIATKRAGLVVSSQLLQLATVVEDADR